MTLLCGSLLKNLALSVVLWLIIVMVEKCGGRCIYCIEEYLEQDGTTK